LFRKALAAAPDNSLATKLLSDTYKKQGRDPNSADVRCAMGDQLASINDFEGATVEYQCAMQLEPSARTYTKIGDMALRYGQYSTATNWYTQAIVKDPNYGPAHRQIGLLELMQKDFTDAAASLRKAVVLDPTDAAAGQTLVQIWRREVANNPRTPENRLGLAGALQLTGDLEAAENEYRQLEALDPQNPGLPAGRASLMHAYKHREAEKHRKSAEALFNQGLNREALAEISQATMMEPKNAKYQFLLAECLESNNDYQGAYQAYMTSVLIDPDHESEAAARLRELKNAMRAHGMNVPHQASQIANNMYQNSQQSNPNNGNASSAPLPPATPQAVAGQSPLAQAEASMDSPRAGAQSAFAAQAQPQPQPAAPPAQPAVNGATSDTLSKIGELESSKNYDAAISALRQLLASNLQNADVHHRLAVDLLANSQMTESISEFRMASALRPDVKEYASDLAQALAIYKRSLSASSQDAAK
jgi:Flp pilus assembly protein TadD